METKFGMQVWEIIVEILYYIVNGFLKKIIKHAINKHSLVLVRRFSYKGLPQYKLIGKMLIAIQGRGLSQQLGLCLI